MFWFYQVNILCEENNLLAENNKERKNLINGEANEESLLGSSGKNSSRCSSEVRYLMHSMARNLIKHLFTHTVSVYFDPGKAKI